MVLKKLHRHRPTDGAEPNKSECHHATPCVTANLRRQIRQSLFAMLHSPCTES